MEIYSPFDYLCKEPFYINGIGYLLCPTLRDIRKITYRLFSLYVRLMTMTVEDYRSMFQLEKPLPDSLYETLLFHKPQLLIGMIKLLINDSISFDEHDCSFHIYRGDSENREPIGRIGKNNFEAFCLEAQCILGTKTPDIKEVKFKNDYARALYESIQKNEAKQKKQINDDYELDNMVKKYCTHNKVGINILNVWDLTYYQFTTMFNEYCNGRQYDFNDQMAANTFSYKKTSDYKPGEYMKKLK